LVEHMKARRIAVILCFSPIVVPPTIAQDAAKKITCDVLVPGKAESPVCTHQYLNGDLFKTATANGMVITVAVDQDSKYMTATIGMSNNGAAPVDILPSDFVINVSTPSSKTLHVVPPQKIALSEQKSAQRSNTSRRVLGGFANALSAAAGSGQRQSTTQTTSSGTVSVHSSDGTYSNGTYNGTSSSTTSSPDPAAQERAAEQIRQRNAAISAANAQRNATASAANARLMQTALSANTIAPGRSIGGVVYFEGDKKARKFSLGMAIGDTLYEFKFDFE
jgi:hypothetical protein